MRPQYETLLRSDALVAVVGATDSPGKYGGIIYRDLKARGHRVIAVNPNRDTVDGDPSYPDLASLPQQPDIVNMVIGPADGSDVVDHWASLGGDAIWFQPGAHDSSIVRRARDHAMDVVEGDCIMVISRQIEAPR